MKLLQEAARERVKQAIKETMLDFEEVSRVVTSANITMLGNLSLEEENLLERRAFKKEMYQRLVMLYRDTEFILNQTINDNPNKMKKISSYSAKLKELRDQRMDLLKEIKDIEAKLESVKIGKEGGDQIHQLLFQQFDLLRDKLDHAKKQYPDLYEMIEAELSTFFKINLPVAKPGPRR